MRHVIMAAAAVAALLATFSLGVRVGVAKHLAAATNVDKRTGLPRIVNPLTGQPIFETGDVIQVIDDSQMPHDPQK